MLSRYALTLWALCLGVLPSPTVYAQTPPASSATPTQAQGLIDKVAPSIVTIRVVLKIQMKAGGQSQSSETKLVTEGVVVTPNGLVMMSNAPISSDVWARMAGGDAEDSSGLTLSPTDFKVTIGDEPKEYTAFLAATDTKLGLAFLQIEDLGDRKLPAVDFTNPASVSLGDQVAAVTRLSKGYDYAPVFAQGQIKGAITKPRAGFLLATSIVSVGLPVFTLDGVPAGVMILMPGGIDSDSSGSSDMMMRFYSSAASDRMGIFMIPGATVQPIIGEAVEQAAKVSVERAKNPPAKPATPVVKPEPKTNAKPAAK